MNARYNLGYPQSYGYTQLIGLYSGSIEYSLATEVYGATGIWLNNTYKNPKLYNKSTKWCYNKQVPLKNENEYFSHLNFYENIGFFPSSHSSFISMLYSESITFFFSESDRGRREVHNKRKTFFSCCIKLKSFTLMFRLLTIEYFLKYFIVINYLVYLLFPIPSLMSTFR